VFRLLHAFVALLFLSLVSCVTPLTFQTAKTLDKGGSNITPFAYATAATATDDFYIGGGGFLTVGLNEKDDFSIGGGVEIDTFDSSREGFAVGARYRSELLEDELTVSVTALRTNENRVFSPELRYTPKEKTHVFTYGFGAQLYLEDGATGVATIGYAHPSNIRVELGAHVGGVGLSGVSFGVGVPITTTKKPPN
jgi:hypothetical protein